MFKSAIALCLLVQVSAADPAIVVHAAAGASYTSFVDPDGYGPELVVGVGVAPTRDASIGIDFVASQYDPAYAPGQTLAHDNRGVFLVGERRFGRVGLGLGLGFIRHAITREFADPTIPSESWALNWTAAARISVAVTIVEFDGHAIEAIAAIDRSVLAESVFFGDGNTDPSTSVFLGVGYRFMGAF